MTMSLPETSETILIVDDDEYIREMLLMAFKMEGYEAVAVANGQEALDWMRISPRPCLILLDYMMPVMNGRDFLAALDVDPVFSQEKLTIVMVTAFTVDKIHPRLSGFLSKPIELDKLLEIIGRYCHCKS
ncbi:response regulator [Peredibacter starrii]|uniref:Response regulator n=1 Tax=Peredibacter starrii TaxID=28202 RepID=A0AAX4HJP0_9BACT|nr:response regulator [Peredibacter starrii]WPU63431.1 response regulator [Peredibacter starrii]